MSEYKGIKGFQVQTRTEDPVPYAQALADNPYAGAWASGGALNTARNHVGGAGVSNNSALAVGGSVAPRAQTENYNGSSWTEVNDLNNGRTYADCAGTATAALAVGGAGGSTPATAGYTESWDGTNWTEVADLTRGPSGPQSTVYGMTSGVQTSALYYGGDEGQPNVLAKTESWDGSSWTEVADLNTARSYGAGIGTTNTSALCVTGLDWGPGSSQNSSTNEQWNGSAWTELAEPNQGRGFLGCGNYGSVTSALIFGGRNQGPSALFASTESWNGSAWTEVNDLATARLNAASGSGTATAAMFAGGGTPSVTAVSEEWSFSGLDPSTTPAADYADAITGDFYYNSTTGQFKQINTGGAPIGTWSSGGSLNTAREDLDDCGVGPQTEALVAGGKEPAFSAKAENYNGSAWTEVSDLNTARASIGMSGVYTSAIAFGGQTSSPPQVANVETWNGSAWTETTDLNTARMRPGSSGVTSGNDALAYGGGPPYYGNTEKWNGSSWTELNDLNETRTAAFGSGSTTAALAVGGEPPSSPFRTAKVEEWDGTNWTEINDLNSATNFQGNSGTVTSAIAFGGSVPSLSAAFPLAVAKSPVSAQDEPSQNSVRFPVEGYGLPIKAKADVDVPDPAKAFLAVFKSPTSVQAEPSHCSAKADTDPVVPP